MRKEVAPAVALARRKRDPKREERRREERSSCENGEREKREREREEGRRGSAAFSVFLVRWPRREGVRELSSYSSSSSSASWAVTSTSSIEDSPR